MGRFSNKSKKKKPSTKFDKYSRYKVSSNTSFHYSFFASNSMSEVRQYCLNFWAKGSEGRATKLYIGRFLPRESIQANTAKYRLAFTVKPGRVVFTKAKR